MSLFLTRVSNLHPTSNHRTENSGTRGRFSSQLWLRRRNYSSQFVFIFALAVWLSASLHAAHHPTSATGSSAPEEPSPGSAVKRRSPGSAFTSPPATLGARLGLRRPSCRGGSPRRLHRRPAGQESAGAGRAPPEPHGRAAPPRRPKDGGK